MVNIAAQCLGKFHGLVEEAIQRSEYTFITVENISKETNIRLLDVQYTLADMRDAQMISIKDNRVYFTKKMLFAKKAD